MNLLKIKASDVPHKTFLKYADNLVNLGLVWYCVLRGGISWSCVAKSLSTQRRGRGVNLNKYYMDIRLE